MDLDHQQDALNELLNEAVNTGQLDLSSRSLERLPSEALACAGLVVLNLSSNALTELPLEIGTLGNLVELDLSFNKLLVLPASLSCLTQLVQLDVSYNRVESLFEEVGALSNLQSLSLHDNQLQQLPPSLGRLSHLQDLQLQFNDLSSLPHELSQLSQLTSLLLEGNPRLPNPLVEAASREPRDACAWLAKHSPCGSSSSGMASTSSRPGALNTMLSSSGAGVASAGRSRPVVLVLASPKYGPEESVRTPLSPGTLADLEHDVGGSSEDEMVDAMGRLQLRGSTNASGEGQQGREAGPGQEDEGTLPLAVTATRLEELQELPPAAAAVLYRSMECVQAGVAELRTGRPLTRGGTSAAGPAAVPPSLRPGTSSSGPGRPGSARPSSSAYRPGSSLGLHPRPGTSGMSPRPGTSSRPGTGGSSRPGTGQQGSAQQQQPLLGVHALVQSQAAGAAAGRADQSWDSLPPITFPMTAGVRSMLRKLSAGTKREGGAAAGGADDAVAMPAGSSSNRPGSATGRQVATGVMEGMQQGGGGDEDSDAVDVVRALLLQRNPQLAATFEQAVYADGNDDDDEGDAEGDVAAGTSMR